MIKAISYWSMKDGLAGTHPIADALAQAKAAGFAGLELAVGGAGELTPETTRQQCEQIRKAIDQSGVRVDTVACGLSWAFNPTSEDAAVRAKSIDIHKAAIERTAWLGAKAMLMVPGVVRSPIAPAEAIRYDRAVERSREAVRQVLEVAQRVGVDLCIENVWNGLFYSPLELAAFVDSFKSERLGVYFDVGNCLGYQQYPPHWIELLGKRIKRVHIKDYKESFAWVGGYSFCALGAGDVPWEQTMAALRGVGYDATLVAEMLPWDAGVLKRTSVSMDQILGR